MTTMLGLGRAPDDVGYFDWFGRAHAGAWHARRRSQIAGDGGWLDVFTLRRKERGGGGRGQEGSNGLGGGEALSREGRSAYYCGCGLLVEIRCDGGSEAFGVWLTRQRASSFEEGPGDVSL